MFFSTDYFSNRYHLDQVLDPPNPTSVSNNGLPLHPAVVVSDDQSSLDSRSVARTVDYDGGTESLYEVDADDYHKRAKVHKIIYPPTMDRVSELSRSSDEISSTISALPSTSYLDMQERMVKSNRQFNAVHGNYSSNPSLAHSYASIRLPNSQHDDQRSVDYLSDANSTKNNCGSDTESRDRNPEVFNVKESRGCNGEVLSASHMHRTQALGEPQSMRTTSISPQIQPLSLMYNSDTSLQRPHIYASPSTSMHINY